MTFPPPSHWAKASLRSAEQAADPRLMAHSLARIAVFEFLQGNGARLDLLDRAEALDASAGEEPDRAPAAARPAPGQRTDPQMVRPARRGAAEAGRPSTGTRSTAETRHRCRSCCTTSASSSAGPGTGIPPRNTRWRAAGWPRRAASSTMRPATLYSLALVRAHRGQVAAGPGTRERGARPVRAHRERPGRVHGAFRSRVRRAVAR